MTYLFAVSIGPVQEFIAAARRTADLQAGSRLLVDIAEKIAITVREVGRGELIFPAEPKEGGVGKDTTQKLDAPNKILATIRHDYPQEVADAARRAASDLLRARWQTVKP